MGLITCLDCGKEVSDTAAMCPYCGKRHPGWSKEATRGLMAVGCLPWLVFPLFGLIGMMIGGTSGFLIGIVLAIVALVAFVKLPPKN
jgi:hypothetical protein